MLMLPLEHAEAIKRHGEQTYPHECCGLLIGRIEDEGRTRVVFELHPVANEFDATTMAVAFDVEADGATADASAERHRRMLIPPREYLRAERRSSSLGLGVIGNYHSHPNHPAVPSAFDLKYLAPWPTVSCVVISVREGQADELRSWELVADGSSFVEEAVRQGV